MPVLNAADLGQAESARDELIELLDDESPLVQATAIDALDPLAAQLRDRISAKLESENRLVRVKAAWALRRELDWSTRAGSDLKRRLDQNADQAIGALQWAQYYVDIGEPRKSAPWFEKAIERDSGSAPFLYAYAVALDQLGNPREAIDHLVRATELEPDQSMYPYALGLMYASVNNLGAARDAIQAAIKRDETQARYWYNLALAESRLGNHSAAEQAMLKAEQIAPEVADYPYARATIMLDAGEIERALEALRRTLEIDPSHPQALQILNSR
jgi:tetratricopeptide (TPR) repeat protein